MSDPAVPACERRIHRRRPLVASVWLVLEGTKIPVSIGNASVGGAAVQTTAAATVGEIVTLEVAPATGAKFVLSAKVVRALPG